MSSSRACSNTCACCHTGRTQRAMCDSDLDGFAESMGCRKSYFHYVWHWHRCRDWYCLAHAHLNPSTRSTTCQTSHPPDRLRKHSSPHHPVRRSVTLHLSHHMIQPFLSHSMCSSESLGILARGQRHTCPPIFAAAVMSDVKAWCALTNLPGTPSDRAQCMFCSPTLAFVRHLLLALTFFRVWLDSRPHSSRYSVFFSRPGSLPCVAPSRRTSPSHQRLHVEPCSSTQSLRPSVSRSQISLEGSLHKPFSQIIVFVCGIQDNTIHRVMLNTSPIQIGPWLRQELRPRLVSASCKQTTKNPARDQLTPRMIRIQSFPNSLSTNIPSSSSSLLPSRSKELYAPPSPQRALSTAYLPNSCHIYIVPVWQARTQSTRLLGLKAICLHVKRLNLLEQTLRWLRSMGPCPLPAPCRAEWLPSKCPWPCDVKSLLQARAYKQKRGKKKHMKKTTKAQKYTKKIQKLSAVGRLTLFEMEAKRKDVGKTRCRCTKVGVSCLVLCVWTNIA